LSLIGECFLFFAAGVSGDRHLYHSLGNDVILPCDNVPPSQARCLFIDWIYERDSDSVDRIPRVDKGKVNQNPPGGSSLSLRNDCSLIISNITAEDAGRYTCRSNHPRSTLVHLNILTISPSPADTDPERDDEVTLTCSMWRYNTNRPCPQNSILWVDEEGTVLPGEDGGYKFNGQMDCVSNLAVKRQSDYNRSYTCQFIEANSVKIDAHFTLVYTDPPPSSTSIIVGAVVGVLVVLVVIAAVLIKYRRRAKATEGVQKPTHSQEEPESNLTYITVNHANQNPKRKVKVKEEAVTYSTVKNTVKADNDPSSFYSSVG
ncbi:carcinoembryonic antigen-related cell adhesion molecule 2-like, partial [Stegastes partitus]|uniref:Carcinoembryonic antigen-related cell adhesion molecule 2-like n=1 Tax=Stegastes partitus TaxID=144197 RepID=A0A9Y4NRP9_9TELE